MLPYLEYLSSNRLIKFPFSEKAELPSTIPNDLLVDLLIVTETPEIAYYMDRLEYSQTHIKIYINGNEISISRSGNDSFGYFDGSVKIKLLVGRFDLDLAYGSWTFTQEQTLLESCCIVPYSTIVKSVNDLSGDIILGEGYNTNLVPSGKQVEISFIPGSGSGNTPCSGPYRYRFISKINKEQVENNLGVKGLDCIGVIHHPSINMIVIEDKCKPCCKDCADKLVEITSLIDSVQTSIDALDVRITDLGG